MAEEKSKSGTQNVREVVRDGKLMQCVLREIPNRRSRPDNRRAIVSPWMELTSLPFEMREALDKVIKRRKLRHVPPFSAISVRFIHEGPATVAMLHHFGDTIAASARKCSADRNNPRVGELLALSRAIVILDSMCQPVLKERVVEPVYGGFADGYRQ